MSYGNDHHRKRFTVLPGKNQNQRCFNGDCINEKIKCSDCFKIKGKWINYIKKGEKE